MAWGGKVHKKYFTFNGAPTKQECYTQTGAYPSLYDHCLDRSAPFGQRWLYWNGTAFVPDPELNKQETITIPTQPPSSASGASIVVHPTGGDDTNNIKAAIIQAKQTRRPLEFYGVYRISSEILIDIDHYHLKIIGNWAEWIITTSAPITAIKRRTPVDNNEALNIAILAHWDIQNLIITGASNQNGIEPGPQYGANISNNNFNGLKTPIHARFCLYSRFLNNMYTNCFNGCLVDCGVGAWNGATNFNSQSNSCEVSGRYYGNSAIMAQIREAFPNYKQELMEFYKGVQSSRGRGFNILYEIQGIVNSSRVTSGGVPFGFYGVSGGWLRQYIVEGVSAGCAVDFDALSSNVVRDFDIQHGHIEMVNGFSDAAFNVSGFPGGQVFIGKQFGQYPSKFLKASCISGLGYLEIGHVPWWIGKGATSNGQGKCFETSNITLHFEKNYAFNNINAGLWDGPMPINAGAEGTSYAAYHTYTLNKINPS